MAHKNIYLNSQIQNISQIPPQLQVSHKYDAELKRKANSPTKINELRTRL